MSEDREQPGSEETPPPGRQLSVRKRWLFRLLALSFSFVLIALAEGVLRLAGYGGAEPFWYVELESEDGRQLLAKSRAPLESFFPERISSGVHAMGSFREERVLMPKPPGMLRIVIAGESSVEGFPFPRNLTAASFLEFYCQVLRPGQPVEVINLGVTAVASFPVRLMAEDALRTLDPDILVVYTGHNEFFGACGVASTQSGALRAGGTDLAWVVRQTAVSDALSTLFQQAAEAAPAERGDVSINLIEEMARVPVIEPGGALHRRANRVLEANLEAIADAARDSGVPLVLCTLASNEADIRPIRCFPAGDASAQEAALAILQAPGDDWEKRLLKLETEHPLHAMPPWVRGTLLQREGRREEALPAFRQARDLDAMPWRATTAINQTIRDVAADSGAILVDAEELFQQEAQGAVGWNLMADHLHPSLEGQALLGRSIALKLQEAGLLGTQATSDPAPSFPAFEELSRVLGANRLELAEVYSRMAALVGRPPLGTNNQAAAAHLKQMSLDLTRDLDPVESRGVERRNASIERRGASPMSYHVGMAAMEARDYRKAAECFNTARAMMTPFSVERFRTGYLVLLALRQNGDLRPSAAALLRRLQSEAGFVEQLAAPGQLPAYFHSLGGVTLLSGDTEAAARLIDEAAATGFQPEPAEAEALVRLFIQAGEEAAKRTPPPATDADGG